MGWERQGAGAAVWRGWVVGVGGVAACAWLHGRGVHTVAWWPRRAWWAR